MELQLVTFNQAKALKELGFPQIYDYTLNNNGNRVLKIAEYLAPYAFDSDGNATVDRWNPNTYSCIPLELVAKWLRDEKDLWIHICKPNQDKTKWSSSVNRISGHLWKPCMEYNSYEKALGAGIDKAIEILKEEKI